MGNNLQGAAGRIACSLTPVGFELLDEAGVLEKVSWPEDRSGGVTHMFTVAVDKPESFKLLVGSKTYGKFKENYTPLLNFKPAEFGFVAPLTISCSAALKPPVPEKKK